MKPANNPPKTQTDTADAILRLKGSIKPGEESDIARRTIADIDADGTGRERAYLLCLWGDYCDRPDLPSFADEDTIARITELPRGTNKLARIRTCYAYYTALDRFNNNIFQADIDAAKVCLLDILRLSTIIRESERFRRLLVLLTDPNAEAAAQRQQLITECTRRANRALRDINRQLDTARDHIADIKGDIAAIIDWESRHRCTLFRPFALDRQIDYVQHLPARPPFTQLPPRIKEIYEATQPAEESITAARRLLDDFYNATRHSRREVLYYT